MNSKIIVSSKAVKDLQDSFDWYEGRSEGLGKHFIGLIDKAIELLSQNPESYPIKNKSFREFVLNKFPYVIIYEFVKEDNVVYILHIFHTKRNPKLKYK